MQRVLFICTGNYYRSRFAEIVFNRLAEKDNLSWRADSRGLAIEMAQSLPGVISVHTTDALDRRGLKCDSVTRSPRQLAIEDLTSANRIIALKEAEHRPLMLARYPGWEDRIQYWHVHDIDGTLPEVAMGEIESLVQKLVTELSQAESKVVAPGVGEDQIFSLIGEGGFTKLVAAFYAQIPGDSILGPMYPKGDFAGAEDRLRGFLIQRFGGPTTYSQERGHPRLRMRHAPFAIDLDARNRWVKLMDHAMDECKFPANIDRVLRKFMRDTATFMINR